MLSKPCILAAMLMIASSAGADVYDCAMQRYGDKIFMPQVFRLDTAPDSAASNLDIQIGFSEGLDGPTIPANVSSQASGITRFNFVLDFGKRKNATVSYIGLFNRNEGFLTLSLTVRGYDNRSNARGECSKLG